MAVKSVEDDILIGYGTDWSNLIDEIRRLGYRVNSNNIDGVGTAHRVIQVENKYIQFVFIINIKFEKTIKELDKQVDATIVLTNPFYGALMTDRNKIGKETKLRSLIEKVLNT
jgi:hypothetical protein